MGTASKQRVARLWDALEFGWGVIANVNGGDWGKQSEEWQRAAARFRDLWHEALAAQRKPK